MDSPRASVLSFARAMLFGEVPDDAMSRFDGFSVGFGSADSGMEIITFGSTDGEEVEDSQCIETEKDPDTDFDEGTRAKNLDDDEDEDAVDKGKPAKAFDSDKVEAWGQGREGLDKVRPAKAPRKDEPAKAPWAASPAPTVRDSGAFGKDRAFNKPLKGKANKAVVHDLVEVEDKALDSLPLGPLLEE